MTDGIDIETADRIARELKIRSAWREITDLPGGLEPDCRGWQRDVNDGHLTCLVGTIPGEGCHLSISHRTNTHPPKPGRYPRWDEIKEARYRFCPGDVTMAMLLPPLAEYVNVHDTTFHLHEIPGAEWRELPRAIGDLLSAEEREELRRDLAEMARRRRRAEVDAAAVGMP